MTSYEFEVAAKNAVIQYAQSHYGETWNIHDIHLMFFDHMLEYQRAIMIDSGMNTRYYEVTYDAHENVMYVDIYEQAYSITVPGDDLDFKVHE